MSARLTPATTASIGKQSLIIGLVALSLTLMPACDSGPTRAPASIRAEIIESILQGVKFGSTHISAESFNAASHELIDMRVKSRKGLYYAKRATVTVDETGRNMTLKLFDVLLVHPTDGESQPDAANPPLDENAGNIQAYREFTIADIRIQSR